MSSKGSDYGWFQTTFRDKSITYPILATDSGTLNDVIAVRNSKHTLFIQRILLSVTTDAAQTLTFQDDNSSALVIAKSGSSPGIGIEIVADFGPRGRDLTQGKNLDIVISGAGLGGQITIEAYEKATGPMIPGEF